MEFLQSISILLCFLSVICIPSCDANEAYQFHAKLTGYSSDNVAITRGGGTWITRRHIVTAATVVNNVTLLKVQYGAETLSELLEVTVHPEIFIQPDFDPATLKNDIAVVVLPEWILGENIYALNVDDSILYQQNQFTFGFGWSGNGTRWEANEIGILSYSLLLPDEDCFKLLEEDFSLKTDTHLCRYVGPREDTFGLGDIGSAAMCEGTLTGVLSVITNYCDPAYPYLFTAVHLYSEWILGIVRSGESIQEEMFCKLPSSTVYKNFKPNLPSQTARDLYLSDELK